MTHTHIHTRTPENCSCMDGRIVRYRVWLQAQRARRLTDDKVLATSRKHPMVSPWIFNLSAAAGLQSNALAARLCNHPVWYDKKKSCINYQGWPNGFLCMQLLHSRPCSGLARHFWRSQSISTLKVLYPMETRTSGRQGLQLQRLYERTSRGSFQVFSFLAARDGSSGIGMPRSEAFPWTTALEQVPPDWKSHWGLIQ